jgi:hypothetical protein
MELFSALEVRKCSRGMLQIRQEWEGVCMFSRFVLCYCAHFVCLDAATTLTRLQIQQYGGSEIIFLLFRMSHIISLYGNVSNKSC